MFEWLFGNADRTRDSKVSKRDKVPKRNIEEALDLIAQYLGKRIHFWSYTKGAADLDAEDWTNEYSDTKMIIESEHRDSSSPYRVRAWLAKDHTLVFDSRPNREWDSSVGRWIEDTSFREGAWMSYVMEELLPKARKRQNEVEASLKKKQEAAKEAAERTYADKVRHRNRPVDDSDVFR